MRYTDACKILPDLDNESESQWGAGFGTLVANPLTAGSYLVVPISSFLFRRSYSVVFSVEISTVGLAIPMIELTVGQSGASSIFPC